MDDRKVNLQLASKPHSDKFQLHIYAALAEQERGFTSIETNAAFKEGGTLQPFHRLVPVFDQLDLPVA